MRLVILFFLSISLVSCSRKILLQEAYLVEEQRSELQPRVDIRSYYAGDAFEYISFQIDVDNRSEDTIYLSEQDIDLKLRLAWDKSRTIRPIRKKDLINSLWSEGKAVKAEKNVSTATNLVLSGVNILGGILAGADGVSTIFYGAGTAVDIIEDRRYFNAVEGTIEEHIDYIDEYTLEEAQILPGRSASYDIHFERLMANSHCELVIDSGTDRYVTVYELAVVEKKIRR